MTVTWNGHLITQGLRLALMRGVFIGANLVRTTAINSITSGEKSGNVYTRRGVTHRASAPGEPPAADLGNLHNSITIRENIAKIEAVVNASAKYARALEYGTQKMEPRPFMRPALAANLKAIEAAIALEARVFLGK